MNTNIQLESLTRTLAYLTYLHDEFTSEIETKTAEIEQHHSLKTQLSSQKSENQSGRKIIRDWRRKSFALHQRRSRLKDMKDTLSRQIDEVQRAQSRLAASQNSTLLVNTTPLRRSEALA
jgi:chromosome segregation ATPase